MRHRQRWPRIITRDEWTAKAPPNAPPLPWLSDDGVPVCSFAIVPVGLASGFRLGLYDAYGREVLRSGDDTAIITTALVFGGSSGELTFLPAPSRAGRRLRKPA